MGNQNNKLLIILLIIICLFLIFHNANLSKNFTKPTMTLNNEVQSTPTIGIIYSPTPIIFRTDDSQNSRFTINVCEINSTLPVIFSNVEAQNYIDSDVRICGIVNNVSLSEKGDADLGFTFRDVEAIGFPAIVSISIPEIINSYINPSLDHFINMDLCFDGKLTQKYSLILNMEINHPDKLCVP